MRILIIRPEKKENPPAANLPAGGFKLFGCCIGSHVRCVTAAYYLYLSRITSLSHGPEPRTDRVTTATIGLEPTPGRRRKYTTVGERLRRPVAGFDHSDARALILRAADVTVPATSRVYVPTGGMARKM